MPPTPAIRPRARRLIWRQLGAEHIDVFHTLATDEHIRRYLLDGAVVDRAWCVAEIERSAGLFERQGLGLWLLWLGDGLRDTGPDPLDGAAASLTPRSGSAVGFAGYRVFETFGPAPQLLYAFTEAVSGRGLATEAGRALLDAGYSAGLDPITAAVDGPNVASLRVLLKLGFTVARRDTEGVFGETVHLVRPRSAG